MENYPSNIDPRASYCPWNQSDPKPVEVDCCVSYSLSKSMPVKIQNYSTSEEYESDIDDEGHRYCHKFEENNFDDTNFIEEFKNDDAAIGIPTLLQELYRLSGEKIEQLRTEGIMLDENDKEEEKRILKQIKYYQAVQKASDDWTIDELDVCQE